MPDGGKLLIQTRNVTLDDDYVARNPDAATGDYAMLAITDTGSGMPPHVLAKVFEPFFTTKGVGKGTGLGLAMVYGGVQQHGGMINVCSEPDIGTTFRIYLPIAENIDAAVDEQVANPAIGGKETILIAEDEPMVRDLA